MKRQKHVWRLVIVLILCLGSTVAAIRTILDQPSSSLILVPDEDIEGTDVSLVLLHGANCYPQHYEALGRQLMAILALEGVRLWIGLPRIVLMNSDVDVASAVSEIDVAMTKVGMDAQYHFISGHSLGGVSSQQLAYNNTALNLTGQILMSAPLQMQYDNLSYPVLTLMLGGEKDGLLRISRMAHAAYMYRDKQDRFPVVIIPGMNHMGYTTGRIPAPVKALDLHQEITKEDGHAQLTLVISYFIASLIHHHPLNLPLQEDTSALLSPLIQAMLLEGSWNFARPCDSDHPSPHCAFYPAWPPQSEEDQTLSNITECMCGSSWVEQVAQPLIGDLEGYAHYEVVDAFHDVQDTEPSHHAHLWNGCDTDQLYDDTCLLNITTVTQLIYPTLDQYDTGGIPITASEMRAKMMSRQAIYQATVDPHAKLEETDRFSFCTEINDKALKWALSIAPEKTRNRYINLGVQMVFEEDIRQQAGPAWINSSLRMQERKDNATGEWVLYVQSSALVTDVTTGTYLDLAGYHYCKLLSPARAMEWIYVDSLRRNDGTTDALRPDKVVSKEEREHVEEEKVKVRGSNAFLRSNAAAATTSMM